MLSGPGNTPCMPTKPATPIGVVPAGTGNGIAKSLGIVTAADSLKAMKRGVCTSVDVIGVNIGGIEHHNAILSIAWGAIADFDRLAERDFRWYATHHLAIDQLELIRSFS
jgi:sphingosine kinase